jgi:hypothetical protein
MKGYFETGEAEVAVIDETEVKIGNQWYWLWNGRRARAEEGLINGFNPDQKRSDCQGSAQRISRGGMGGLRIIHRWSAVEWYPLGGPDAGDGT